MVEPARNAYTEPRRIQPGCTHHLGCKCDVPYHLRESTLSEKRFEARAWLPPEIEESE